MGLQLPCQIKRCKELVEKTQTKHDPFTNKLMIMKNMKRRSRRKFGMIQKCSTSMLEVNMGD